MSGPRFVVAAGYGNPDPAALYQQLATLPRPDSLNVLASINGALAFGGRTTAAALAGRFTTREALRRAIEQNQDVPLNELEVFSRITLLQLEKLVLSTESGPQRTDDLTSLGELALRLNDYLVGSRFRGPTRVPSDEDVMLESLATWDLTNERDLAAGLARVTLMLRRHWLSDDAQVQESQRQISVTPASAIFDGVSLDSYFSALFGVYTSINAPAADLISGARTTSIRPTICDGTAFPTDVMRQVLVCRSRTADQFRQELTGGSYWTAADVSNALTEDRFLADVRPFRQTPFLQLPGDLFCCLDVSFLSELLTTGVYWRVLEALPRAEGDAFQRLWGRLFELYTWGLLRYHYSGNSFREDVLYSGGQIDGVIDLHDDIVLLEFKGSLLRIDAKYERDITSFERDFRRKFVENEAGDGKGITQLARAAVSIASGERITRRRPHRIYPVLVAYEPGVESFFVNRYANRLFAEQTVGHQDSIRPLTLMSIQELEFALPYLTSGDLRWVDLLESRFGTDSRVALTSVYQAVFDWPNRRVRRNEFIREEFARIVAEIVRRFGLAPR